MPTNILSPAALGILTAAKGANAFLRAGIQELMIKQAQEREVANLAYKQEQLALERQNLESLRAYQHEALSQAGEQFRTQLDETIRHNKAVEATNEKRVGVDALSAMGRISGRFTGEDALKYVKDLTVARLNSVYDNPANFKYNKSGKIEGLTDEAQTQVDDLINSLTLPRLQQSADSLMQMQGGQLAPEAAQLSDKGKSVLDRLAGSQIKPSEIVAQLRDAETRGKFKKSTGLADQEVDAIISTLEKQIRGSKK